MDEVGRYILCSIIVILLVLIAMFFSSSEVAVTSISKGLAKKRSDEGDLTAKKLLKLKDKQSDFSAYCSMSSIICTFFAALLGFGVYGEAFDDLLCRIVSMVSDEHTYISHTLHHDHVIVSIFIMAVLMLFITIILGNTLPKKLVLKNREGFSEFAVKLLPVLGVVFKPLTYLPIKLANGISRLMGVDPYIDLLAITEDEIRMLVDVGNENGSIELSEREMINNVFEFDDRTIGEVMTHRTSICAVNIEKPLIDVINVAIDEGFSRIPIYENDIDNIVGTIYVKDLLIFTNSGKDISKSSISDYIRSVIYAPESARCITLFKELKEMKIHMAVIVDEYGGTAGIVTMEDLLESIVGNIQDEYDQEEEEIQELGNETYSLDGGIDIEQVCKLFDVELVSEQHSETLAGLITNVLGYIPQENETPTVTIGGVEFTVKNISDRRIERVLAKKIIEQDLNEQE